MAQGEWKLQETTSATSLLALRGAEVKIEPATTTTQKVCEQEKAIAIPAVPPLLALSLWAT